MGFLALLALGVALASNLFTLGPLGVRGLAILEWTIVALFALEYGVHLSLAERKRDFVRNPWRILDLAIIVIPLLSLLPFLRPLRSSPVLRLLRLSRVVLFGARFGGRAAQRPESRERIAEDGPTHVSVLREGESRPESTSWDQFLQGVPGSEDEWYHVAQLSTEQIGELARTLRLPDRFLQAGVEGTVRPRIEVFDHFSALFLWLPEPAKERPLQLERTSVMLITTAQVLLTFSQRRAGQQSHIGASLPRLNLPAEAPFPTQMTYAFIRVLLERYHDVQRRFEDEVRRLEDVPAKVGGTGFFGDCFALERELTATRGDLWRLKGVLASISEGKVRIQGQRDDDREFLRGISEEAESLHESVSTFRESLVSLMDLHMNVASFEMNKGMRLLAILSALGLLPAVVGGLLGMNLVGNPWPATLPQVAFGVFWGMALAVYIFFIKGWIR
jgi:Mg2+ and Co2+ transporter CorA